MSKMREPGASSNELPKTRKYARRNSMETFDGSKQAREGTSSSTGNGSTKKRVVGKRRQSPVGGGLRDNDSKAIKPTNYYAVLSNTAHLDNENDHIMIGVKLRGKNREVTINAMIDSGATDDFIDKGFCDKYGLRTTKKKTPREILLADGEISAMGPVTHIATVPMNIGSHREMNSFEVANLPNHEVILGMPWLRNHNPRIDWGQGKITFESDKCTEKCLKESPSVYAIPEDEAREENLHVEFGAVRTKKDLTIKVKRMDPKAKVPTKGSPRAAGHDQYANEDKIIPRQGQEIVNTGLAITVPRGTYGRIAPRSGLAIKHQIAVNAGVIDIDYTGEVKVILLNLGKEDYQVKKGERIAPRIRKHRQQEDFDMRDQCNGIWQILSKKRYDNGDPSIQ